MNLVAPRARASRRPRAASRPRAPAWRSIRAPSTRRRRSREVLARGLSLVRRLGATSCRRLFAAYVEAKQAQNVLDYDDLLLYWAQMAAEPALAARHRRALRPCAGRRIPGHQPPAGLDPAGAEAGRPRPDRGRRRRAVDLFVPRRRRSATSSTSPATSRRRPTWSRSTATTARPQPILAAANAVIGAGRRALHQEPVDGPRPRPSAPRLVTRARRGRPGPLCLPRRSWRTARPASALKAQAVLFRASHHSGPLEIELTRRNIPFVKFGGLKFLDAAHVKDVLAVLRLAENPRDRVAGFRVLQLLPGIGPATRRRSRSTTGRRARATHAALAGFRRRRRAAERLAGFRRAVRRRCAGRARLAGRARAGAAAGTSRISSASTRTPPCAAPTSCSSSRSPPAIPRASASSPN